MTSSGCRELNRRIPSARAMPSRSSVSSVVGAAVRSGLARENLICWRAPSLRGMQLVPVRRAAAPSVRL